MAWRWWADDAVAVPAGSSSESPCSRGRVRRRRDRRCGRAARGDPRRWGTRRPSGGAGACPPSPPASHGPRAPRWPFVVPTPGRAEPLFDRNRRPLASACIIRERRVAGRRNPPCSEETDAPGFDHAEGAPVEAGFAALLAAQRGRGEPGTSSGREALVLELRPEEDVAPRVIVQHATLGIDVDTGGGGGVQEVHRLEVELQILVHVEARGEIEPRLRL